MTELQPSSLLPFPEQQILDSSRQNLQTTNVNLMKMAESSPKRVENTWKRRNCSLRAISSFSTVFSKDLYSRQLKQELVWERVKDNCR